MDKKLISRWSAIVVLIVILAAGTAVGAEIGGEKKQTIGAGEKFETDYFIFRSEEPGPTVFLVGGIHGDEPAGAGALEIIRDDLSVGAGKVIILPRANNPALEAGERYAPGARDLNRAFPVDEEKDWTGRLASEIWNIVIEYEVDIIFDLHEARDFYQISDSVGQTVILNPHPDGALLALHLVTEINQHLPPGKKRFTYISPTVQNSLTRVANEQLEIPTFIFETTVVMPMEERVSLHEKLVYLALDYLEILEK